MDQFKLFSQSDVLPYVKYREGEEKIGQYIQVIDHLDNLSSSSAKFVLLGIPEDIGVRANLGIGGAHTAWKSVLISFLNIQQNPFLKGEDIILLGEFKIDEPAEQTISALRNKTLEIDALVYPIIQQIVQAGKIPIVIGGGHNNALPIITGTYLALNKPLNVINIDAHADMRSTMEGRHSGNGFSFALQHGYLNAYRMFGLHQNYVHQNLSVVLQNNPNIKAAYFEQLLNQPDLIGQWLDFIHDLPSPCGLEIDVDGIANCLSSAMSSTGLLLNDVRRMIVNSAKDFCYLHICEAATLLSDGRTDNSIGKTIAYLISDFIKALQPRNVQQH